MLKELGEIGRLGWRITTRLPGAELELVRRLASVGVDRALRELILLLWRIDSRDQTEANDLEPLPTANLQSPGSDISFGEPNQ